LRLSQARDTTSELCVREKLDLALSAIPIDSVIEKMSQGDSRIFHISALRQEAKKYEDVCQAAFLPCTDMGFLDYLQEKEPPIPSAAHTEAVSILTYHSAKGLEWPVVILSSLDKEVHEPDLFEVRQEMIAGAKFNSKDPLANRVVTYVPWPFGDHKKVDEVDALVRGLPEVAALKYAEESETRRLLYVGMTRAREKLVLFNSIKKTVQDSMLGVLEENGEALISFDSKNSKILVSKKKFDCSYKENSNVAEASYRTEETHSIVLPQATPILYNMKRLYLQPSHLTQTEVPGLKEAVSIGRSFKWGEKLLLKKVKDLKDENSGRADIIGSAVHLFLASVSSAPDSLKHANRILKTWNLTETLDANDLVLASERLNKTIIELWPQSKTVNEVPMEMNIEGSVIRGAIDCIVMTSDEIVIIDHKTLTAKAEDMEAIATKYRLQLAAYAKAASRHFRGKKVSTWIHNPDGWMCEVILG